MQHLRSPFNRWLFSQKSSIVDVRLSFKYASDKLSFNSYLKSMLSFKLLLLEMSTIKTTRLIVHRNDTRKVPLVSSPFLYHVVFVVHSPGSHLVVSWFVWDNRGKVFINQSWYGISHPAFPVYDTLSTSLANYCFVSI